MPTVGDRRAASAPTGLVERVAPAARGGEHVVDRLAGPERVTQLGERRDERAEPLAQMVLVRRGDVLPDARRTAGKPRRVHETGSGQLEPGVTPEGADDVHQGTDGQLWEVADRPDQAVVQLGTHDVRDAAEAADELLDTLEAFAGPGRRRQNPLPSGKQIRPGVADAAPLRARHRMAAGEPAQRHRFRGRDDLSLRTADVGDERPLVEISRKFAEDGDVRPDRGGENDEVRTRGAGEASAAIDRDDLNGRPSARRSLRDRAADQAEPDDRDAPEKRL